MRARTRPVAVLTALLLAAAGCGSSEDAAPAAGDASTASTGAATPSVPSDASTPPGNPSDPSTSAPLGDAGVLAAAVEASSGRATRSRFASTSTTPQGEIEISGEGVSAADGATSSITLQVGGIVAAQLGAPGGTAEVEVRLVDGVTYQRIPGLLEQLPGDAEWLAIDAADLPGGAGDLLDQSSGVDAAEAVGILRDARDVREVRTEDVDGVPTTVYEAVVDGDAASGAQQLPPGVGDVPVTVWIDDEGLVRRIRTEVAAQGATAVSTVDVVAYDVEVDVEAPPADSVVDVGQLGGLGQGPG